MTIVKDIMTSEVHTIGTGESIAVAAQRMSQHSIRHLVVVDKKDKPQGVFSERDVLRYLVRSLSDPPNRPKNLDVGSLTAEEMLSVQPQTDVTEAASIMADKKIGCLPVLGSDKSLTGIITAVDICRYTANGAAQTSATEDENQPSSDDSESPNSDSNDEVCATAEA